jgi:Double zinc ribbon
MVNPSFRIFCPVHEVSFAVEGTSKILCEVTGHSLATDFPNGEVWEYCCNCETFSPSRLCAGEKAGNICFGCQNEIVKRFLCAECKILSFECDSKPKGQRFFISEQGIAPACPGCNVVPRQEDVIGHDCREIETKVFTSRNKCLFCLENTKVDFVIPSRDFAPTTILCQNCRSANPIEAGFCGKCRHQLRNTVDVALGTDEQKSQLLGSLCPNCSTPVPPASGFCGECGQAVKTSTVAPPPPPPPPQSGTVTAEFRSNEKQTIEVPGPPSTLFQDPKFRIISIAVAGVLLFIVVVVAISGVKGGSSNGSSRAPSETPKLGPPPGTPNVYKSDRRIGKTGTLIRDANLREIPGGTEIKYLTGTHFRGAKVRILDVAAAEDSKGNTYDWFKIQVTSYGESMDANNAGLEKTTGSADVGWIHSFPKLYDRDPPYRADSIRLDP